MYRNATLSKNKFVMRVPSNFKANETIKNEEWSLDGNIVIDNWIYPMYVKLDLENECPTYLLEDI